MSNNLNESDQNISKEENDESEIAPKNSEVQFFLGGPSNQTCNKNNPRFTVVPVKINNEKDWLQLRSQVPPRIRTSSYKECGHICSSLCINDDLKGSEITLNLPKTKNPTISVREADQAFSCSSHSINEGLKNYLTKPRTRNISFRECDQECSCSTHSDDECLKTQNQGSDMKPHLRTTKSSNYLNGVPASLVPVVLPRGTRTPPRISSPKNSSLSPFARLGVLPHGATIPPLHDTTSSRHKLVLNQLLQESGRNIQYGTTDGRTLKVVSSSHMLHDSGSLVDFKNSTREVRSHHFFDDDNRRQERARRCWRTKLEFLLTCIGASFGLGSFWRFPYLCLKYGRVAFLVPYFVIFFFGGLPILLSELFLGQFTQRGPIQALRRICPISQGVGVSLLILSLFSSVYHSFIFSESILSLGLALGEPLTICNSTPVILCTEKESVSLLRLNLTNRSSTAENYEYLLDQGHHKTEAIFALLATVTGSWVIVYFALWKSVRSIGKVSKVSASVPFVLVSAFVWRAVTLPGATMGLQYLFTPQWKFLMKGEVWVNAALHVLVTLNVVSGSSIVFSSYNKFSNTITTDVGIIGVVSCFSALLPLLVVFSGIGHIADESGFSISEIDFGGIDLPLIVYPKILSKMPQKHIWAALFFLLLLLLGIDSQFGSVEVIVTSVSDNLKEVTSVIGWETLKTILSKHEFLVMIICLLCFCSSLPFVIQGHVLYSHLRNFEEMKLVMLFLAFCEAATLSWVFGSDKMRKRVQQMTSKPPSRFYIYCWKFLTPTGFLVLWVISVVSYKLPYFQDGQRKTQIAAVMVGWVIAISSVLPIPIFSIKSVLEAKEGSLRMRLSQALSTDLETNSEWEHSNNQHSKKNLR